MQTRPQGVKPGVGNSDRWTRVEHPSERTPGVPDGCRPGQPDESSAEQEAKRPKVECINQAAHPPAAGPGADPKETEVKALGAFRLADRTVPREPPVKANQTTEKPSIWLKRSGQPMQQVRVETGATVAQLQHAEAKLFPECTGNKAYTLVGERLEDDHTIVPGQTIVLHATGATALLRAPCTPGQSRIDVLDQQFAAVASDEMEFYLNKVAEERQVGVTAPIYCQRGPKDTDTWLDWIGSLVEAAERQSQGCAISVLWMESHWHPVMFKSAGDRGYITTTPAAAIYAKELTASVFEEHTLHFAEREQGSKFPDDCGFQAIRWLQHQLTPDGPRGLMTSHEACQNRQKFREHCAEQPGQRSSDALKFGGGSHIDQKLQQLVVQHGVQPARAAECASQIIERVGLQAVEQALKSSQPWTELKVRTSQLKPPMRIVLPSELQAAIDAKASRTAQVGSTTNKMQRKAKHELAIRAEHISIPSGVFVQEGGGAMPQVPISKVGPMASGVVVLNIDEALPLLAMPGPLAKEGLALVVLEHSDSRMPADAEEIRFPAHCRTTEEAILLTGALVQLGAKKMGRPAPSDAMPMEVVDNQVVRVLQYRDQHDGDWDQFSQVPPAIVVLLLHEPRGRPAGRVGPTVPRSQV